MPDYAADPEGKATPLDSHIRLANAGPCGEGQHHPAPPVQLLERRDQVRPARSGPVVYLLPGHLEAGFITVQSKLNGEPLEEYIKPVGGGYFYTLPEFAMLPIISAAR